ncbi:hypothetical protein Nhal_3253 [Nitrosococcus halophilus Nc 4]|uniref:Uncharacterized protein n=1 Tax=Nitrosococcus halophilus (strain Nc4) TaxID=472759 RepID=D5C054_NITHN|nr:hypothetical protein [Nitrosococcus halophilus]ADE16301.1 hypothetical protein Nhal_3253 [Nitrosococcus halophilus Nc 4]
MEAIVHAVARRFGLDPSLLAVGDQPAGPLTTARSLAICGCVKVKDNNHSQPLLRTLD